MIDVSRIEISKTFLQYYVQIIIKKMRLLLAFTPIYLISYFSIQSYIALTAGLRPFPISDI